MEPRTYYSDAHLTLDFERKSATLDSQPLSLTRTLAILESESHAVVAQAVFLREAFQIACSGVFGPGYTSDPVGASHYPKAVIAVHQKLIGIEFEPRGVR